MHPQWRCLGSRIESGIALPRADSGHGGLGCVGQGGTHRSLARHCESLPAEVRVRPDTGSPVRSRGRRSRACDESSCPILLGFALHGRCIRALHLEPIGGAPRTVGGVLPLRHDTFEAFSNVVMSRSMNHNGVEFLVLARPGRYQWTVVISYPRSTNSTKIPLRDREMKRS